MGREQIDEQIKAEIALQVKGEVTNQIETHLPIPLTIQAAEVSRLGTITLLDSHDAIVLQSQEQLAEVRVSLQNRYDSPFSSPC